MDEVKFTVPFGYCHCLCGGKAPIAAYTSTRKGWVKGQPKRFIAGHYPAYQRRVAQAVVEAGKKVCPSCSEEWPLTVEYFGLNPERLCGFRSTCRECERKYIERYREKNPDAIVRYRAVLKEQREMRGLSEEPKLCPGCEVEYPATPEFFYRNSSLPSGFSTTCKACRSAENKEWWHGTGKHDAKLMQRKREYDKAYYSTPAGILSRRQANIRRDAAERKAEGSLSGDEIWQMYEDQGGLCAYCETPLFGDFHVDHIQPISRGGRNDWSNAAVSCATCNLRKHVMPVEEFMVLLME